MTILESEIANGVLILTLNDPDRRNVLSVELCDALSKSVASANANPELRMIILTGSGSAFCAGADLGDLEAAAAGDMAAVNAVYRSFMDVAESPLITLAAVNGPAVGAGFNLALACDMRIASERARFDTRFLTIGLHPGGGHCWMLLRAVGWAEACKLLFSERMVRAKEARDIGLVQRVVPQGELLKSAIDMAAALAAVPPELAVRTKATLGHAVTADHRAAFQHETTEQAWSLRAPAFTELVARLKSDISTPKDKQ